MFEIRRLNVSLTKHGAHKVAALLRLYDASTVLEHLSGSVAGINIEAAQAKKTLAADANDKVPAFWNEARKRGSESIDGLVFVAIVLSHSKLIAAMRDSDDKRPLAGTIKRGVQLDDKAFTNFAHIVEELGYSTAHSSIHVAFDLHKLFKIKGLHELALKLISRKLMSAGWDGKGAVVDAAVSAGFHDALSLTETQFRAWLLTGAIDSGDLPEDEEFFFDGDDATPVGEFKFAPGHNAKKTGKVEVKKSKASTSATLLHNAMQNALYAELCSEHGKGCVGTEVPTGAETSIDIVVKTEAHCWFYEIKTAMSVKACIRQALPQLLEYAYWHGDTDRADRLIVVGPVPLTTDGERYLAFLREHFGLELYYHHHPLA